eukprot:TRINITY_DN60511_c0_g1_i1.p1 TRINITY_DN60511_c0_g1~~TRINITY_DN60511_c0_g1_i1.p1  ORF type:complete len:367 (+),score=86.84 TRINITY_DN60511_c0_g1_i1:175-1275(+)
MGLFTNESDILQIKQSESGELKHTLTLLKLHGETRIAQQQELQHLFERFDSDHDGQLSQAELRQLVRSLYQDAVKSAAADGAPKLYIQRAVDLIESAEGTEALDKAADELMDRQGVLTPDTLWRALTVEAALDSKRGTHWRMAPIVDLKLELDDFVDDQRPVKLFLAGALAGACARTAGAPLARITILQQTAQSGSAYSGSLLSIAGEMVRKEGVRGIFRGNLPDVCRAAPQQGISFLVYEKLKTVVRNGIFSIQGNNTRTAGGDFLCSTLAGGSSGVVSVMCTYPLDLVRTRMAAGSGGSSLMAELQNVIKADGLSGLYRGAPVACAEKFPNLAINFALYDTCLLYTSDAADEEDSVDLGGRRII